ncbi:DUF3710 domain-containing protein [Plantactinospora siamensis]|uniref:DUF3710 domain-containing protein n=1 Tax=Plantactinospora siamensis TaxID=555372 RepID=A0ABV6NSF1_9ACTN
MIFSKGRRGAGRHERANQPEDGVPETPATPSRGPYDAAEAPAGVQRLDLGSLQIPAVEDVEVRVQADPDGTIQQVVLVHGENALQLGAFAAPRSEGIWDEVRDEIEESLRSQGARTSHRTGEYGTELLARVDTPDGPAELRFVGVDGPRWMVRALYQGAAAADPGVAGPLDAILHGLVVDRGQDPRPVREGLPLRLPKEVADQAGAGADAGTPAPVDGVVNGQQHPLRANPSPRPRNAD